MQHEANMRWEGGREGVGGVCGSLSAREGDPATVGGQGCPVAWALSEGSSIQGAAEGPHVCLGRNGAMGGDLKEFGSSFGRREREGGGGRRGSERGRERVRVKGTGDADTNGSDADL